MREMEGEMSVYQVLREAILKKQQVIATYNGYSREMCPHTLGKKNGKEHCLFYQFGGQSSSGHIIPGSDKNWRCIPVNGLMNVFVREGQWHTASNHSRKQTCIDQIDVEVSL
jgi:hypothetical protein